MSSLSLNHATPPFIDLPKQAPQTEAQMRQSALAFYERMRTRRSIREFASTPVPRDVIETCLLAAGSAPSGANQQPWHFAVVHSAAFKKRIREEAENEEREFYAHRAPQAWKDALAPLGTDASKPFLEDAPYLIAIFGQKHTLTDDGTPVKNYYVPESVSIATGFLIAALHHAGLATLTHTPSPMGFLNELLHRPDYEKPYILLVVGYPKTGCQVPNIAKKALAQIASFL